MGFWDSRLAAKENLRMFQAPDLWRRYADELDVGTNAIKTRGCSQALEGLLLNGLNSTNLLLLSGAGSSLCAVNPAGSASPTKIAPHWDDLWTAVKNAADDKKRTMNFDAILAKIPSGTAIKNIEKLLTQCKLYVALYGDTAGDGKTIAEFIALAEAAILDKVDFVDGTTDLSSHETLLLKIARRGVRKPRAKVFTTNYDLCFEYAAQRRRFTIIDGFSHASPQMYDRGHFALDIVRRGGSKDAPDYLDSVFQFYKLHGSLDWRRVGPDIVRSRGPEGKPVLIYPRDSKYQEAFEPPYLDMMGALQTSLREPDTTLFVAGFGFNDSHIAEPIIAALESNMSFRLVVCDPAFIADSELTDDPVEVKLGAAPLANTWYRKMLRLAQTGDQRIALLHGRFEDLALALPDLVAQTERERLAERVRALRDIDPPGTEAATP